MYKAIASAIAMLLALVLSGCSAAIPAGPPSEPPENTTLEATWGVRFTRIAVTADGGLVDVRYTVIDPDRAHTMLSNIETLPAIVAPDGAELRLHQPMSHKADMVAGRSYYILFVNRGNALQSGDRATLMVDDLRIEPFLVQ